MSPRAMSTKGEVNDMILVGGVVVRFTEEVSLELKLE